MLPAGFDNFADQILPRRHIAENIRSGTVREHDRIVRAQRFVAVEVEVHLPGRERRLGSLAHFVAVQIIPDEAADFAGERECAEVELRAIFGDGEREVVFLSRRLGDQPVRLDGDSYRVICGSKVGELIVTLGIGDRDWFAGVVIIVAIVVEVYGPT